ncbi:hypothetical protein MHD_10340 [Mannheimia granulomatis]|uniref:Phage tail protein n=1 Tax=Mannheimia granulomatis TaxID=85402 RepID=A0A011NCC2_9PAST|nr:hypothetical protein [Mannheimia granulomatis]EXI62237.1 phage tail protein [Mannheimia granulomatis]RGE47416.1 hypothetical protein MHD_10340 [Mannheimia granulomatis]
MANLILTPEWVEGIYQLETSDPVMGGPDGIDNRQAKQLGNRTAYLKAEVEKRAPTHNPNFTGTPKAPTPEQSVNDTTLATTAYVKAAIAALVGSAPAALDTLAEIAVALGSDGNLKNTLLTELSKKVNKAGDTMTGPLIIDHISSILLGKRNGILKYGIGLRNTTSDDLVLVRYRNGVPDWNSDTYLELLEERVTSNRPFYERGNKLNSISVIKGVVGNGSILPLPSGYNESQCHWIVSMSEDVALDRIENTNTGYTKTECYVGDNRRVVARVYSKAGANTDSATGKKFDNSRANYLVIGVK